MGTAIPVNNVNTVPLRLVEATAVAVEVLPSEESSISKVDARKKCQEIKASLVEANAKLVRVRELVYELEETRGYLALGYDSLRQLWESEFGRSKSQLYRHLDTARVEMEIFGEVGVFQSESHARPLSQLPPGERRKRAVEKAQEAGRLTQAAIAAAVEEIKNEAPVIEEILKAFARYGKIVPIPSRKYKNAFRVVRYCRKYPNHLEFNGVKEAWGFMCNPEKWGGVERAIAEMGEYNPERIPWHCMSCAHSNQKVIDGETFHYCSLKFEQIHHSQGEAKASEGCWISAHDEGAAARAEMARTHGDRVKVLIDGVEMEAIALHFKAKYVCPKTGEIRYANLPLSSITTS